MDLLDWGISIGRIAIGVSIGAVVVLLAYMPTILGCHV